MAKLRFVTGVPASVVFTSKGKRLLVVSDLHIGLELELKELGFRLPSQTARITRKLVELLSTVRPHALVILGDVKHDVKGLRSAIRREVEAFLAAVSNASQEVIIVRGNHDGSLKRLEGGKVRVASSSGIMLDDVSFFHGNAWPHPSLFSASTLLMGHIHPSLPRHLGGCRAWVMYRITKRVKDKVKSVFNVTSSFKRLIVQPAYNEFLGSGRFNAESFRKLSPIFRRIVNPLSGYVYSLDGTFIGRFSSLAEPDTA
ncbi:MAG: metallophosphoesterase [Candidatus Nezhaarchaeota archaeon]|nr:metallophosphoesterase [Candidatus Nezhaarchaeota archaeon]